MTVTKSAARNGSLVDKVRPGYCFQRGAGVLGEGAHVLAEVDVDDQPDVDVGVANVHRVALVR